MGAPIFSECKNTTTLGNVIDYVCRLQEGLRDKNVRVSSGVKLLLASLSALRLSLNLCISFEHASPVGQKMTL